LYTIVYIDCKYICKSYLY